MPSKKPYGLKVTDAGRSMIAAMAAGRVASLLNFAKIWVGKGVWPDGTELDALSEVAEMLEPVAEATSTVPTYDGDTVHLTVEYRSDMNGGLEGGFWLSEFGIYVTNPDSRTTKDEEPSDILFAYCSLGDKPQYVSAFGKGSLDIRRFPVAITIGEGIAIETRYDVTAFMTTDDVKEYCNIVILPLFIDEAKKLIGRHNEDPEAHPDIQSMIESLNGRMSALDGMVQNDIRGNPFSVTFENLDSVDMEGTWNREQRRIEF